jgi:hypothetical protein
MITKLPDGMRPMIAITTDINGNVFEAYVLRNPNGGSIKIDVRMAEYITGGICAIRNGIEPYHQIVCEVLV